MKFVGYKLQGDRESLAGLPQPIHEGVTTLKKVLFICWLMTGLLFNLLL